MPVDVTRNISRPCSARTFGPEPPLGGRSAAAHLCSALVVGLLAAPIVFAQTARTSSVPGASVEVGVGGGVPPASTASPKSGEQKPEPGSDERQRSWTDALRTGVEYRGRLEQAPGAAAPATDANGYYLSRTRFDAAIEAGWFGARAQVQDAHALGYGAASQTAGVSNTLDLRQAYVELHGNPGVHLTLRTGRQELSLGEERLIGASNWGNTARTFDAVRWSASSRTITVDGFVGSVVVIAQDALDRRMAGETLSGIDIGLKVIPRGLVAPYVIVERKRNTAGQTVSTEGSTTYTFGTRAAGALPKHLDYSIELALQRGRRDAEDIHAWAGHYAVGWTVAGPRRPRVTFEVNQASGDDAPGDGRSSTFDQLYPTNHSKYGIADEIGWRNMREGRLGLSVPAGKVTVSTDLHRFWLATPKDALYAAGGRQSVSNRAATSRIVGTEVDLQAAYAASERLSIGAGVGTLWSGRYLLQSGSAPRLWAPYLTWTVSL